MSSEWPRIEIGQVAKLRSGFPFKSADWKENGVPVIKIANVKGGRIIPDGCGFVSSEVASKSAEWYTRTGDVLIAMTGYVGEVAQAKSGERYLINQRVGRFDFTPNAEVEPTYLFYHLQHPDTRAEIEGVARGSAQPNLSAGDAHKIKITLPPLVVQRQIAATLGALDDRITLLRETNTTLEAIAQALFKSWFVDFDPVRAKMEGRAPEGMDEATAALFPDSFEETELGVVPRGWRESTLGELFELTKGCSYKGDGLSEADGAYMFNLGCFNAHRVFASEKVKRYTGEYKPRHAVQAGDLIIANTDMTQARDILGRPAFVPMGFDPGFISHHVYKVSVRAEWQKKARAIRSLLFFALQESAFRERAIGFATGTTVLALPSAAVLGSAALIPTIALLDLFDGAVQPIFEAISTNEQRVNTLADTRDTLLPRLISGQLRLPEAVAELEALA